MIISTASIMFSNTFSYHTHSTIPVKRENRRSSKMALCLRYLPSILADLSLNPRAYMAEGKNKLPQVIL